MRIWFKNAYYKIICLTKEIEKRGSPIKRSYFIDDMNARLGIHRLPDMDTNELSDGIANQIIRDNLRTLSESIGFKSLFRFSIFIVLVGFPVMALNMKSIRLLLKIGAMTAICICLMQIIMNYNA